MATINPSQDYDCIHTLTFSDASGTVPVRFYRGSTSVLTGQTFDYRMGTSGAWTSATSDNPFNVSRTSNVMQVAHNWNKTGNDYMTASFQNAGTLTELDISQKAAVSGVVSSNFMNQYAQNCTNLTSLDVPDTSGVTSVGDYFMRQYAHGCTNLTSLDVPDLNALSLASLPSNFMANFATNATSLEEINLPDNANIYDTFNVNWSVPEGRLDIVKGLTRNVPAWTPLLASGKTLHTNYIRSSDFLKKPLAGFALKLYQDGKWLDHIEE